MSATESPETVARDLVEMIDGPCGSLTHKEYIARTKSAILAAERRGEERMREKIAVETAVYMAFGLTLLPDVIRNLKITGEA